MFTRVKNTWNVIRTIIGNRKALSMLLVLSMLLTIIPISDVWAAPAFNQLRAVDLPVYLGAGTGIDDYMRVYVMQDPDTGNPVYCTRKGSSLPANSFALDMADINNNPILFYRLNSIYGNGQSWVAGSFTRTTPNNNGIDYSGAATYFGYITNQIAIWMTMGRMGYQSGNLVGGSYGGYNIYDAYINGTIMTMNNATYTSEWTLSQSIPDSTARAARQSYLNDVHNASTILYNASQKSNAAMALSGSYTIGTITVTASLSNLTGWTYNPGDGNYYATVTANVDNGGTWEMTSAPVNCFTNISSGGNGATISIVATLAQMKVGAHIRIHSVVPPEASLPQNVLSLFTSNGQSFLDLDTQYYQSDPTVSEADLPPLMGQITLYKQTQRAAGYNVPEAGAVFQIIDQSTGSVVDTQTTDGAGNAASAIIPYSTYTIHQITAPAGTFLAADQTVTVGGSVPIPSVTFTNTVGDGRIAVNKTTNRAGTLSAEPGAVFQIYLASAGSYAAANAAEKNQITTDASGYAISKVLPYGLYSMVQTATPAGTVLNVSTWQYWVGQDGAGTTITGDLDTANIDNAAATGYLQINKTSSRGANVAESGAVFEVFLTAAGSYVAASAAEKDLLTTNAAGTATSKAMPYGLYTVHQTGIPAGTKVAADFTVTLGAVNGATIATPVTNLVYWGSVTINKTFTYGSITSVEAGAVFQIYNAAYASYATAPATEKDQISTNASGTVTSKSLPYGTYTIRQTAAPVGTLLNAGTWSVLLGADGAVYVDNDVDTQDVSDLATVGKLEISKMTNRGFSVAEQGATFEIYANGYASYAAAPNEYKTTITTDASGYAITGDLPYAVYSVHQTVVPVGTKAAADFTVTIGTVNNAVIHRDLVDQTYWGDIQIVKYKSAPSDTSGTLTSESGATFQIYPAEYASYADAIAALTPLQASVLTDEITSDMGGVATTNHQLPYGLYAVTQINTIVNLYTFKVDTFTVLIGEADNQVYTYVKDNKIYEQYLAVIKTDAETGEAVKLAGATFQILADDGVTVLSDSNGNSSFTTDLNGRIDIKDLALQVGNYYIKETAAPMGYVLNTTLKAFAVSIADHGTSIVTIDYGVDIRAEQFADTAQTCKLTVEKTGDILTGATKVDTGYTDQDGTALSSYAFSYGSVGKAGAVFEVFVGTADIVDQNGVPKMFDTDGDGTKETSLTAGKFLGTITTAAVTQPDLSEKYIALMAGLPLDSLTGTAEYILREVQAPTGDLIYTTPIFYAFRYSDQTIEQISQEQTMADTRQKVQITVDKQKEAGVWNVAKQAFDWPMVQAEGILFGLYTKKDITAPDDSVLIPADTLVDVLFTNANGIGTTTQDLPFGSYYVKELKVTEDVVMDATTTYDIATAPLADQTVPVASFAINKGTAIVNRQIAGTMEIYKIAADTQLPMAGVVFEVYDKDANLVDTVTTGIDGHAQTTVLPFGAYTLIETKTITGYALADKQSFSIYLTPHDGETFSEAEMTVVDQKMAQVEVFKVTADGTQTPMNGVVFGVFDAKTNLLIARITTYKDGYGVVYVLAGNYYLQEIKTWDGYALSTEKIPITAEFAHLYTFRQTNTLTELRVTKTSTSGTPLAGMQFTVTNKVTGQIISFVYDAIRKGYVAISVLKATPDPAVVATTLVTGTDGTALILGLVEGEYIVTEIVAPAGYNLDSKPTATIIGTRTSGVLGASVTIKNSPVTAKTGEIGNNSNLISSALCCLGLATAVFIILRDRKGKREKQMDQK